MLCWQGGRPTARFCSFIKKTSFLTIENKVTFQLMFLNVTSKGSKYSKQKKLHNSETETSSAKSVLHLAMEIKDSRPFTRQWGMCWLATGLHYTHAWTISIRYQGLLGRHIVKPRKWTHIYPFHLCFSSCFRRLCYILKRFPSFLAYFPKKWM
jgi:hypothetical protein